MPVILLLQNHPKEIEMQKGQYTMIFFICFLIIVKNVNQILNTREFLSK